MFNMYKKFIWLSISIVLLLPMFTYGLLKGDDKTWIGYFGSYFGSIVGGITGALIAFGVAKLQIDHQKEYESNKSYISQLPIVVKLGIELMTIEKNLVEIREYFAFVTADEETNKDMDKEMRKFQLIEKLKLEGIISEKVGDVSKLHDPELQESLINLMSYYESLIEVITFDSVTLVDNIQNVSKATTENVEFKKMQLHSMGMVMLDKKANLLGELEKNIELLRKIFDSINKIRVECKVRLNNA